MLWLTRRHFLKIAGTAVATFHVGARAQTYPARPIRLVVPFPAGGPTDVLARIVGQRLADKLGQAAGVDNKPGARGMIGAELVAKTGPEGPTPLANASMPRHKTRPNREPPL